MDWWQAGALGLVEGITEYLPVSSTGHLILTSALLGLDTPAHHDALAAFEIVIQGGAILAVLGLYRGRVVQMLRGLAGRDPAGRRLLGLLLLAFLPAAAIGPFLDHPIEQHLFRAGPVLAALLLGGAWMIWLGRRGTEGGATIEGLDTRAALAIGIFQCVAMWPGTSRSMMTIAGGVLLGMSVRDAAEFSFLLGLPTLGAACLFKLAKNLLAAAHGQAPSLFAQLGIGPVVVGLVVATVAAALSVRWLVGFLGRRGLGPFGWYRIALSLLLGGLAWAGALTLGG
jgi:undecaprenyl-diphosphatase